MTSEPQLVDPRISTGGPTTSESDARAGFRSAHVFSQQVHADLRRSLALLRGFLGFLAGLPGRKAVIYVADRLPVRPGELVWRVWFDIYGNDWGAFLGATSVASVLSGYDTSIEIRDLIAAAGATRVAFYPVGTGAGTGLLGAESRGLQRTTGAAHLTDTAADGLSWIAQDTGGQAAVGAGGETRFFDRLRRDLAYFYSLGFPFPHRGDGEAHAIEVRVRRPEVKVRYLSEYCDKSPRQQVQESLLASLVLDVGENPLGLQAEVGPSEKRPEGMFHVPLRIDIPVANLVLVPDRKVHSGKVSVQLIIRDEKGRFSDPATIDLPVEIPHGAILRALSESLTYNAWLTLRPGPQTIAVGVHDELGSTTSIVSVRTNVGADG